MSTPGGGWHGRRRPGERPAPPAPPLWRQAFDAAERAVAPRAEDLVRTEYFPSAWPWSAAREPWAGRSVRSPPAHGTW